MNKTEIISLLKLLEDPDENIYRVIKDKILDNGEMFKIYLENYHSLSMDELAIERSENLLDEISLNNLKLKLINYVDNKDSDLLDGVLLLETYFNRDIDTKQIKNDCEEIIHKVWLEINDGLTVLEKVRIINTILFQTYNFRKYPIGEFKQEYLSFTNFVSYKKYISPTISLLYCIIAERVNIPIYPIEIPGIFLVAYVNKEIAESVYKDNIENKNSIVFYIHPYDGGGLIDRRILEKYIKLQKMTFSLSDVKILSNNEFMSYLFKLRISVLAQTNKDGFEVGHADEILNILNKNNNQFLL
jgi:hypothetical protein